MNTALRCFCLILAAASFATAQTSQPVRSTKISQTFTVSDEKGPVGRPTKMSIAFVGDHGLVMSEFGQIRVVMNFTKQTIQRTNERIYTLKELTDRTEDRKKQISGDLNNFRDPQEARRMRFELNPQFKIQENGQHISFTADTTACEVDGEKVDSWATGRMLEAARYTEYFYADMLHPPYAKVLIMEELHKRGFAVKKMKIVPVPNPQKNEVILEQSISPLTEKELQDHTAFIAKLPAK